METNGSTTWLETPAGKHLKESLSDQKIIIGLDHLLHRIDTLEKAVEKLTTIMEQGPGMISMVTDMADETYRRASNNGVDIEQRLGNALSVAEKLTSPEMVSKLDQLFQFVNQAPGLISMTMDSIDEQMAKVNQKGIDVKALIELGEDTSTAISKAKHMPDAKVGGIFSMIRTMRDPDRQEAIGFLMNVAKAYGQQMHKEK